MSLSEPGVTPRPVDGTRIAMSDQGAAAGPGWPCISSYALRDPHTLARGHACDRPSADSLITTLSEGTLCPTTVPGPAGEVTAEPIGGASLRNSWYSGCSYFRQHMSRPHAPAIRSGFTGRSWSL